MTSLGGNTFGFAFFKRFATPLVLTLLALLGLKASAHAGPFPAGFQKTVLFSGFYLPTAVRFAPDGHVFIIEKYGKLFAFDSLTDATATVVNDFEPQLWPHHDHGMLGLAVDPQWPTRPYVYVMYAMRGSPGGRISRIEIDPATDQMVGSEAVLVEGWCQIYPSHSVGDLQFGPDGALYATAGDGASFNIVDWGQDEPYNTDNNPAGPCTCSDPIMEGGALRSQDLRTSGDPVGYSGTMIRIDPDTGAALPDNPLYGGDAADDRIVAYGLRNPFRFTFDRLRGGIYICDVGWNTWEEVNYIADPLATPIKNFGWPCYEGPEIMPAYYYSDLPICNDLVSEGSATAPFYTYQHVGGASATGAAIYEGGNYPAKYVGALFIADYTERKIRVMYPNAQGIPDPATVENFAGAEVNPVDLQIGPGGDLFYIDIGIGSLRRIEYVGGEPPVALAEADVTSGPSPLTVQFSGLNSSDPLGGALTYGWDFNNDGDFSDSTDVQPAITFQSSGNYPVNLKVTNGDLLFDIDTIVISVDNGPPVASISLPDPSYQWRVGDEISFAGGGTDPDTGPIALDGLTWEFIMDHCASLNPPDCHQHHMETISGADSGMFLAIDHEYPCFIEVALTVTEPGTNGLSNTASVSLMPEIVTLMVDTQPAGRNVGIFAAFGPAPLLKQAIINGTTTVTAQSPQIDGDTKYTFMSWTDGGVAAHNITIPATDTTYTAAFSANQRPVLAAVGNTSGDEGALIEFTVSATDPDSTIPVLSGTNLPAGATVVDHGDGTATFSWTPTYAQAGPFTNINIKAADSEDSQWFDVEAITITVNDVNPAPVLAAIGNQSVDENAQLQFAVSAADPDGGIPALTATNVPIGASFVDHGDGTGTFTWTPTFAQQGAYANVTFTATDAGAPPLADSEPIAITVNDVNRAPSLGAIGNKSVNENSLLQFNVTATDIDNNGLALSATSLPSGASFVDNGNGTGTFSWTPTFEQSGSYANIGIGAIDDAQEPLSDAKTFSITVNNTNRAPSLALIGDKSVNENSLLQFNVSATDPDGTVPALDVSNLPIGAAFVDNGNGTGTFSWTPTYEQSGVHTNIGISVTDADQSPLSDTKTFSIMVNDVNRAPVLTAIGNQTVIEGQILQVNVSATDADGTTPVLGASNLPPSASFVDNHDGTGTFTWATTFSDSGTYLGIVITATDAADAGLADQKSFNVTVTDENRKPSIDPVPDLSVHEADTVQFVVTASDPDGTIPSLQCTNLPLNAAFIDYGDGTGLFDWLVSYDAADGSPYQLQFIASDGLDTGTASCTITVANTNRPIVLEPIGGQNAVEGQLLSFVIHASSYDVKPAVTAAGMPARARLAELETGDYAFQWTPDYHASENTPYSVTFTADNGESLQSETVLIAVTDATAPGDIVVSRPKAGANWTLGSDGKFKIKWNSVGDIGNKVSIELWRKGAFVSKIKASTANDGAFAWDVPTTSTPGAGYSIRVVSKSNPLVYGKSSGSFTITGSGKIDKD